MHHKSLTLALGLLMLPASAALAAWVTPDCSSTACPAFASQQEYQLFTGFLRTDKVIQMGINRFIQSEARFPSSYDELCASPHIVVRCADIMNPYTGKPVTVKADSPGDIEWENRADGLYVTFAWLQNGVLVKRPPPPGGVYGPVFDLVQKQISLNAGESTYEKERMLSGEERAARALGVFLFGAIRQVQARAPGGQLPPTFPEFLALADHIPVFQQQGNVVVTGDFLFDAAHLRNDYSGAYAHAVDSPSPGDFRYSQQGDQIVLQVYGSGATPIASYSTAATTSVIINQGNAEEMQRLWNLLVKTPSVRPSYIP